MQLVPHRCRHERGYYLRQAPSGANVEVDTAAQGLSVDAESPKRFKEYRDVRIRERTRRNLSPWLPPLAYPEVPVVHEPNGQHALVQFVLEPGGNLLQRPIEISAKHAHRTMRPRPYVHRRIHARAAGDGSDCYHGRSGIELVELLCLESGVLRLTARMSHLDVAAVSIDRRIPEQRSTKSISGDAAQALANRNAVAGKQL